MGNYTYNNGVWETGAAIQDWKEGEEFEDFLKKNKYSQKVTKSYGCEGLENLEIYSGIGDEKSFLASVCPLGDEIYIVKLPDFPSLMMFLKDYSSFFEIEDLKEKLAEILKKVKAK